jgi:preprotein translocase subunit SecD
MEIPYEVIDQKPLDANRTQVVVETQLPIVVNGYGGGRITIPVENDRLQEQIEEKISQKFRNQVDPSQVSIDGFRPNLKKVQDIVDRNEERKEAKRADAERERAEQEAREAEERARQEEARRAEEEAEKAKADQPPADDVVEEDPEPVPPVIEEPPVVEPPVEEEPVIETPAEEPVIEEEPIVEAEPLPKEEPAEEAEPFTPPAVGGLGEEDGA